jgi:hypothetical protein
MTRKTFKIEMYTHWSGGFYSVNGFIWQFNTISKYNTTTISSFLFK